MILYVVVCLVRDTCRVLSFVGNLIQRPCSPKSKPTVSMGPEVKQMDMNQSQVQNLQFVYQSSKGNKACLEWNNGFGDFKGVFDLRRKVWGCMNTELICIYIYWKSFWTLSFFFFTYTYIYTYYWSPTVARLGLSLTGSSLQKLRAYIRGDCILHLWKLLEENQQKQVTLYMSHLAYT